MSKKKSNMQSADKYLNTKLTNLLEQENVYQYDSESFEDMTVDEQKKDLAVIYKEGLDDQLKKAILNDIKLHKEKSNL